MTDLPPDGESPATSSLALYDGRALGQFVLGRDVLGPVSRLSSEETFQTVFIDNLVWSGSDSGQLSTSEGVSIETTQTLGETATVQAAETRDIVAYHEYTDDTLLFLIRESLTLSSVSSWTEEDTLSVAEIYEELDDESLTWWDNGTLLDVLSTTLDSFVENTDGGVLSDTGDLSLVGEISLEDARVLVGDELLTVITSTDWAFSDSQTLWEASLVSLDSTLDAEGVEALLSDETVDVSAQQALEDEGLLSITDIANILTDQSISFEEVSNVGADESFVISTTQDVADTSLVVVDDQIELRTTLTLGDLSQLQESVLYSLVEDESVDLEDVVMFSATERFSLLSALVVAQDEWLDESSVFETQAWMSIGELRAVKSIDISDVLGFFAYSDSGTLFSDDASFVTSLVRLIEEESFSPEEFVNILTNLPYKPEQKLGGIIRTIEYRDEPFISRVRPRSPDAVVETPTLDLVAQREIVDQNPAVIRLGSEADLSLTRISVEDTIRIEQTMPDTSGSVTRSVGSAPTIRTEFKGEL